MDRRLWIHSTFGATLLLFTWAMDAVAQDAITRMSVDSNGAEGNGVSGALYRSSISPDGRYVAFDSWATNLVPSDNNKHGDIFVHDRVMGATVRVSVDSSGGEANGHSYSSALSGDGRFVVFDSDATNLVSGDTNRATDVFVHDRDPDGNGVFDEGNGVTIRVSVNSNGNQGDGSSYFPSISLDGNSVAFASNATNLVQGDSSSSEDIFVHDLTTGTTTRVSVDSSGGEADSESGIPTISADGQTVSFYSWASNLVANDTNRVADVFVHDRASHVTSRVSVDSYGAEGNGDSVGPPSMSSDGAVVAFWGWASNLVSGDTNWSPDVFVHDRTSGSTTRVSVDSAGAEAEYGGYWPSISADGQLVAFYSDSQNLISNDTNLSTDAFVHDRSNGRTSVVSATCSGIPGNGDSRRPAISADGSLIAFASTASDLVDGDTNKVWDVFVRDLSLDVDASWSNYGTGFPGTLGVPTLTSSADPTFGATISIDVGNSRGVATPGLLLVGLNSASIPTSAGGTILVDFLLMCPLYIDVSGLSIPGTIPFDDGLCGLSIYLQALEVDPGARHGISFTPGLQLLIGH